METVEIMQRDGFSAAVQYVRNAIKCGFCRANEIVDDILENGV